MVRLKAAYNSFMQRAILDFNSTNGAIKRIIYGMHWSLGCYFNSTNGAIKRRLGLVRGVINMNFNSTNGAIKSLLLAQSHF